MSETLNVRNSNLELLRILAMGMIVFHHLAYYGIFPHGSLNITMNNYINNFFAEFIFLGGKLGVDIFVLITGYFMINSHFKLKSFLNTYFKTIFYSVIILLISAIYLYVKSGGGVQSHQLNLSLFPIESFHYWFITIYLLMYLSIPFINHLFNTISQRNQLYFLILNTYVWVLVPTFTSSKYDIPSLIFFIYLYFLGASIKKGTFKFLNDVNLLRKLSIFASVFLIIFLIGNLFQSEFSIYRVMKYTQMNSLFILIFALYLFNIFKNMKIGYKKYINVISASTLGVYLIHENVIIRKYLWEHLINFKDTINSPYFVIYSILMGISVYVGCIIVDKIINAATNNPINYLINKIEQLINYSKIKMLDKRVKNELNSFDKV